ncbi:39S ribosomal protein L48, mitochondrial isoform X2 [Stegostoma tigrinum]|uniref:39S ribosomal protein L48, mitochondrial isoform X2 n=1 Tax=Stegostoma tigrinum TaxID=3053191 RepID=UPI00202B34C3|nr:39S ribosomal protein L48, mitochondrial isoform X2 [Stegostoma tigrinum]
MNPAVTKVLCVRNVMLLKQAASTVTRLTSIRQSPLWFTGNSLASKRHYRSMPTHGIGRYKYLLPKEVPRKKREKLQMKQLKPGTDTEYGVLNIQLTGYDMTLVEHYSQYIHRLCNRLKIKVEESYAMPTKSTEISVLQEQGTKMNVEGVIHCHERIVQHTEAEFNARFKARPELEGLIAQIS